MVSFFAEMNVDFFQQTLPFSLSSLKHLSTIFASVAFQSHLQTGYHLRVFLVCLAAVILLKGILRFFSELFSGDAPVRPFSFKKSSPRRSYKGFCIYLQRLVFVQAKNVPFRSHIGLSYSSAGGGVRSRTL